MLGCEDYDTHYSKGETYNLTKIPLCFLKPHAASFPKNPVEFSKHLQNQIPNS